MWAALSLLVLWLAAIAAYAYEDGMNLFQWMGRFSQVLERPFAIGWTPYTLKYMLGSLLLYGCGIALYYSSRENRRPGEEYGSAKWGSPKELNRKYMDHQHKDANIILTQRVRLGMDGYITQRNMNVLVVGGSGSGKTRFFCKPNIYSANCSYLITDPKGELLRAAGALLAAQGYEVRVFNLIDPSQSDGYNPFSYIHSEKDVLTLIDNLIKNTTPRNASSNDPFWEKAEIALDSALMLYLVSEAPPEEQNFEMLIYMMNFAEVREEDDQYRSPLDMLFRALEEEQPNHVAVKQYKAFKQAAGKTAKSILVSAAVRLATFNIPQYARMTMVDEMDFGSLGEKKKAIFCVIPVDDSSMNYLVGMLYTQCFQALYRRADEKHNGRLPVPVRVIQDEWANVAQPESYPKILATCRSYNIGLNIIVQNIQQIKALYEKEWESIIGNCDTAALIRSLPEGLSPEREAVVRTACSLVGKVNYFWGGKSLVIGWDVRWGELRQVTAAGSSTTGTYRPYGLDCSGFVDWVFYNQSGGSYVIGHGGGATMQHSYCTNISWADAQPGDLVFYPDNSHVGIVGGRDANGELLIIHCASGYNNVVVTGLEGFASIARPNYYTN